MGRLRFGSKAPLTVSPQDSVASAARAMVERKVGAAAVLEDGRVTGVVSERDVLQKVVAAGRAADAVTVREIMSQPVIAVGLETTVAAAAALMREKHIRHLVVLGKDGALVGMLALRYLLYDLMDDMERKVGDLEGFIMIDGPGG